MTMYSIENFIKNFISSSNRDRYLELVSTKKGSEKFRRLLDHDIVKDLEQPDLIPKSKQNVHDIECLLRDLKAENNCVAISTNPKIDRAIGVRLAIVQFSISIVRNDRGQIWNSAILS